MQSLLQIIGGGVMGGDGGSHGGGESAISILGALLAGTGAADCAALKRADRTLRGLISRRL